jgi:hypothetical protein
MTALLVAVSVMVGLALLAIVGFLAVRLREAVMDWWDRRHAEPYTPTRVSDGRYGDADADADRTPGRGEISSRVPMEPGNNTGMGGG